jgi:hypothetical protein
MGELKPVLSGGVMGLKPPRRKDLDRAAELRRAGFPSCVSTDNVPCSKADVIQNGQLVCMLGGTAQYIERSQAAQCVNASPVPLAAQRDGSSYFVRTPGIR